MFGRTVEVGGTKFFVLCSPETPLSEVLQRASQQAFQAEEKLINEYREQYRNQATGRLR